ncbi:hypothetical protein EC844_10990 [Acinetobacter calcoaceticus]|uniref:Tellurium resistance protein n=1 Tax=Acinetobacter calcoaceticus TaxID=471 RepID=A0A4V2R171_ACICA|nr:hypothetical protein EC844_10990 [Acinetobacter calcoaceticus]
MQQFTSLTPLDQIELDSSVVMTIKRQDLVPLMNNPILLNQFAEQNVQAQAVLLNAIDPQLIQQLSQVIAEIIQHLSNSKKSLKKRRFNALQKWLGIDLEFDAGQVNYMRSLDQLIDQANQLSQRLQIEIQKSQSRLQQVAGLREQMAHYVAAAQGFMVDYPRFVKNQHPLDNFIERLSKKINTLNTLQSSHDIAMTQMQLSQQLALGLIDRFKEAQQVLIPAWQYHLKQSNLQQNTTTIAELDRSRDKLIQTLKRSLEK